jgi:hypothetical protein
MLTAANTASTVKVDLFTGEVTARTDGDGGVHPYLALFPGAGVRALTEADLTGGPGQRDWRFQVTAAGGDIPRCIRAVQRAQDVLVGQRLDDTTGLIREDGDGGPIRKDTTVAPARWYVPLLFVVEL